MVAQIISGNTTEWDELYEYIKDKSIHTQRSYSIQYRKLLPLLKTDCIMDADDDAIIEACDNNCTTSNSKQTLINIPIVIFQLKKRDTNNLLKYRDGLRNAIKEEIKEKNKTIELPTYQDICDYTNFLFNNGQFREFIINWLLINFNVRNQDLIIKIVSKQNELDPNAGINYIHFNRNTCTYYRFNYKTDNKYGTKKHIITDDKVKQALKLFKKLQDENKIYIVPNKDQVAYYVQSSTLNKIGEGNYNKICINYFREDFQKLKQISENRGTSLDTLAENYDIKNK